MGNTKRNDKYAPAETARKSDRGAGQLSLAASLAWRPPRRRPTDCPRKGTLGTSRVLAVDAATYPRVGLKSFPQTLPLGDHEVVLTFDDGPWPPTTPKVLAALAQECVRATFFLIGKPASEHPGAGAPDRGRGPHHRPPHLDPSQPAANPPGDAIEEIDHGIAAVEMALHGVATTTPEHAVFPLSRLRNRRRRRSICCNRAASRCSAPTSGPATGIR